MFRATAVCSSALSKRTNKVKVQLLKDFPMFQLFKGQVVQVKPSFMRNYLHNFNGARYISKDGDIDQILLAKSVEMEASRHPVTKTAPQVNNKKEILQTKKPAAKEKPILKGILEKDITVKDIKIPGLDL